MNRIYLLLIIILLFVLSCDKNSDSCQESSSLWMPSPMLFSLFDLETNANLLFGDSAVYIPDSIKIYSNGLTDYIPVDYDTLREAISLGIVPIYETEMKKCFLKLSDNDIDTITIHYRDVKFCGDAIVSYVSYSYSFDYNNLNICSTCGWDTVYRIYK